MALLVYALRYWKGGGTLLNHYMAQHLCAYCTLKLTALATAMQATLCIYPPTPQYTGSMMSHHPRAGLSVPSANIINGHYQTSLRD
jgi:hypothetical protein